MVMPFALHTVYFAFLGNKQAWGFQRTLSSTGPLAGGFQANHQTRQSLP